ncbi:MAG: L-2-amino-thiazoline-4-carboxylic acid hydrolase [Gemmatimonadota bacterium]|nr:MAG: L-2-amino-thiazoline-4-carboxylic acid hydrolase [Gemmatimonadota bacterium]
MAQYLKTAPSRRQFFSRIVPACALTCFGCSDVFASALSGQGKSDSKEIHPFQEELSVTYQRLFEFRFQSNFIPIFKAIEKDVGKENLLEMVKKASSKNNKELGQRIAKRSPANDLRNFAEPLRNPRDIFKHANIYEIVEDSETAFEMEVTECLTAKVFRESDAADIGYAAVCHADFALPEGFNPKIKLIRTKTLMQGHDCCNHRYILQG